MTADDKAALIRLIESGHDPEAACASLNLPASTVIQPGPKLARGIQAALRVGTARLRSKVLELALAGDNVQALERQLDRREQAATAGKGLQLIERRVIFKCEKCGHEPELSPKGEESRPLHSARSTTPSNGAAT